MTCSPLNARGLLCRQSGTLTAVIFLCMPFAGVMASVVALVGVKMASQHYAFT